MAKTLVVDGQHVEAGQALFELSTEHPGKQGELTELIAHQLSSRRVSLQSEAQQKNSQSAEKLILLNSRVNNLYMEDQQLDREIELAERRRILGVEGVEKYQSLQKNGFMSSLQTQQRQEDLLDVESKLSGLRRAKLQLSTNKLALNVERNEISAASYADKEQFARALSSLEQEIAENLNRRSMFIVATKTGKITTFITNPGQAVAAGQALATLIPDSIQCDNSAQACDRSEGNDMEVHFFAPSRTTGFIEVGQSVLLRFQAFPYQKFGLQHGSVIEISQTPFSPSELPPALLATTMGNQQTSTAINPYEALYRIKVRLDNQRIAINGKEKSFKVGMTVDADIVQDERKIWEWIMEPLFSLKYH